MDDLLAAYPALPLQAQGLDAAVAAVHGGAARLPGGSFAILRAALDASATACAGAFSVSAGQTLFAPTDAAWQALEGSLGRSLGELFAQPQLLCALLRYNVVAPCGAAAPPEAACGALRTSGIVDQQALGTTFADATLLQADAGSATVYVAAQQAWAKRRLRITGYMKRGAALLVPDLALCGGALVVHVTDAVLVPAAALYVDLERRVRDAPELSITAEAYDRCVRLHDVRSLVVTHARTLACGARSVRPFRAVSAQAVVVSVSTNVAVEPLIPPPPLPGSGMCRAGVPIADASMRTLLAPTDAAWALFFARLGVSKAAVFADVPFLITLLEYLELEAIGLDRPYSPDGSNAGSRYFSFDLFRGQLLRTVIGAVYLPLGTGVNVFNLAVDVRPAPGALRRVQLIGQPLLATEGDNTANLIAPDRVACNGLLHIVDAVLIPPTLTTLQQISFRPELSLFKRLLLSPGLEAVRRSLSNEGA